MARTFNARKYTANGTLLDGIARIAEASGHRGRVVSQSDDSEGAEVDVAGQFCTVGVDFEDVTKVMTVLNATPAANTFWGKEAGATVDREFTTLPIVFNTARFSVGALTDAIVNLGGQMRFGSGNTLLDTIKTEADPVGGPPAESFPVRLFRPSNFRFDNYVAGSQAGADETLDKLESLNWSLQAPMIEGNTGDEVGTEAVDRLSFGALVLSLVFKDSTISTGSQPIAEQIQRICTLATGDVSVQLQGRAQAANYDMKIENVKFQNVDTIRSARYTTYTLTGVAGWHFYNPGQTPAVVHYNLDPGGTDPLVTFTAL